MLRIGLTGGIGSGKSMVARIFSFFDIPIYYADVQAKNLMVENPHLKQSLINLLGEQAYRNNTLNSGFIAKRIFNDAVLLKQMNKLVHPVVQNDFISWSCFYKDLPYVIEEAALIFESGKANVFDYVVVVNAPENLRMERVMGRDGITKDEVLGRMKSQLSQEQKVKMADFVIENDEKRLVTPQVIELHNKFVSLQTEK